LQCCRVLHGVLQGALKCVLQSAHGSGRIQFYESRGLMDSQLVWHDNTLSLRSATHTSTPPATHRAALCSTANSKHYHATQVVCVVVCVAVHVAACVAECAREWENPALHVPHELEHKRAKSMMQCVAGCVAVCCRVCCRV